MNRVDTIVIGAGLSGLACAYYLKKRGHSVQVFESSSRVGGAIGGILKEGFYLELGPNSFLFREELSVLIEELGVRIVEASEYSKIKYLCLEDGSAYKLLSPPNSFKKLLSFEILSLKGLFRLLGEPFIGNHKEEDQSVDNFFSKRFGSEFATRIIATALNGIYAADTKTLSVRSALPFLWELQRKNGSIIKGAIFGRDKSKRKRARMIRFAGGMDKLPQAFANSLSDCVLVNARVAEVIPQKGVRLESGQIIESSNVVISCESAATSEILSNFDQELGGAIHAIPYAPLGMVYLVGNKNDHRESLNAVGFLKQPKKGVALLGALYTSSLFPTECSAQEGDVLLTCFVGGMLNPELSKVSDPNISNLVFQEIKEILGLGSSFRILHTHYWARAIPSYPIGHFKLVSRVKELEKKKIFVVSNWLEKPGLPDCIIRGKEIAERISPSH